MTEVITVEPIYGYGWVTVLDDRTRDAPSAFDLKLDPGKPLCGVVVTPNHEFEGASVILTPRHIERDCLYNVEVKRGAVVIAYGHARLLPMD